MSLSRKKDLICLLSSVVCELLDDSDEDEELLPLKAVLEAKNAGNADKPPISKKPRMTKAKNSRDIDKYSQPSRFEDQSTIHRHSFADSEDELICKITLRPVSKCLCSNHINLESLSLFSLVVNQIGGESISDMDFKANWHMTKGTVESLYQIFFNQQPSTETISAMDFLAFLWSLATNEPPESIETRFKMAKGEIALLERKVYQVILSQRFSYERWPQGVAANLVSEGFQALCGFSGALGVVDCVHFPYIGAPYPGTYQNRSNQKSIIFELACDHRGAFTYSSYYWWPGKWSHMDVHRNANLSSYPIPDGFFLLANRSYDIKESFVTPYAEPKKSIMKKFNEQHLWATNVMKHAVACLTTRFNTVKDFKERTPWVLRKRFATCLLLHNLCTELEGPIEIATVTDLCPHFPRSSSPRDRDTENPLRERLLKEMVLLE